MYTFDKGPSLKTSTSQPMYLIIIRLWLPVSTCLVSTNSMGKKQHVVTHCCHETEVCVVDCLSMTELSLQLQTSNSQSSRVRKLEKGILQDSVLVPMLINIYIHDFIRVWLAGDLAPTQSAILEGSSRGWMERHEHPAKTCCLSLVWIRRHHQCSWKVLRQRQQHALLWCLAAWGAKGLGLRVMLRLVL